MYIWFSWGRGRPENKFETNENWRQEISIQPLNDDDLRDKSNFVSISALKKSKQIKVHTYQADVQHKYVVVTKQLFGGLSNILIISYLTTEVLYKVLDCEGGLINGLSGLVFIIPRHIAVFL